MKQAKNLIIENNAKVEWDEESGQFYAEYTRTIQLQTLA